MKTSARPISGTVIGPLAGVAVLSFALSCAPLVSAAAADELDDLPDLACAQASSALERVQIGCPEAERAATESRAGTSPRDRAADEPAFRAP